jgi:hypothetical protein
MDANRNREWTRKGAETETNRRSTQMGRGREGAQGGGERQRSADSK